MTHAGGVVTVNLSGDMWDPYPAADLANVPDGLLTVQQLVWTVQRALDTDDPVLVTAAGEPTRGVWLDPRRLAGQRGPERARARCLMI